MDGGSNCHIIIREEQFIYLQKKFIPCSLANGAKSAFHGVGVAYAQLAPGLAVLLAPCYFSTTDDVSTISPGALIRYSGCEEASHSATKHLDIKKDGKTTRIQLESVGGLDYSKMIIKHFKAPMKTKVARNSFLTIKPPKFIHRSGHYPVKDQRDQEEETEITKNRESKNNTRTTKPKTKQSVDSNTSSRGRIRKRNRVLNIETFHGKDYPDQCTIVPKTNALQIKDKRKTLLATYLHRKFGCQSMGAIIEIARKGHITGIPRDIAKYDVTCPLCHISAGTKLPRGNSTDYTDLRKGTVFHIDFAIFNVESFRGFVCALVIVEAKTRKKWGFLGRNRTPPVQELIYFIEHLRSQGYAANVARVDEDGALAQSTEFMHTITHVLHMKIDTTGGYNSENNGMVESPIKPIKRIVRSFIIGAAMPDEIWCFAFVYAILIMNHRWNRMIKNLPEVAWHDGNYTLKAKDIFLFGSTIYGITKSEAKKQLEARTEKDPRDYIGLTVDRDQVHPVADAYFVGFANHSSVVLGWDPEKHKIRRFHHCYIDEFNTRVNEDQVATPNTVILRDLPNDYTTPDGKIDPTKVKLVTSIFDETNQRLDPNKLTTIVIELPPLGHVIPVNLESDTTYGFPTITSVDPRSNLRTQIPPSMQKKTWIVAINSKDNGYIEPITAQYCLNELERCQKKRRRVKIEITVHRQMRKPTMGPYQQIRQMADQMNSTSPIVRHVAALPKKPDVHNTIFQCLKDENYKKHWEAALDHQFSKNATQRVLSKPIPRELIPKDVKAFQSVMAVSIKEVGEALWKFVARHCVNGGPMIQGLHFDFSASPTVSYPALRTLIALAAALGLILASTDVTNCFQNTLIPPNKRIWITLPPRYMKWFKKTYPDVEVEESTSNSYLLQTMTGMQGEKDVGRGWYIQMKDTLVNGFGMIVCPAEPALFVKHYPGGDIFLLCTSTDDFLCAFSKEYIFADFMKFMDSVLPVTAQTGKVLKYLNVRIIQTDMGISIDQTQHIKTNVIEKFFPPNRTDRLKSANTPYRSDSEYERALSETLPARGQELTNLELLFGGSFHSLVGVLLHIQQVTRFEIGYAITRLSQFSSCPNEPAFHGLTRIARFLATHLHSPIMYPRKKIKGYRPITFETEPGKVIEHLITNEPCLGADADHARDIKTRKSISCIKGFINGVIVIWIMQKQTCMAAHSTDAETRAYFTAMQYNKYWRMILEFMGKRMTQPTTIYEDNQPCIDIIMAGQITKLVKHIAIPVAMINEDIAAGNNKPNKIDGKLNLPDNGTKPNPSSTFHRFYQWCRGQIFYPPPGSEHGKLLQIHLVNQRVNEVESDKQPRLISLEHYNELNQVFENKDEKKK